MNREETKRILRNLDSCVKVMQENMLDLSKELTLARTKIECLIWDLELNKFDSGEGEQDEQEKAK